jgi:hypothetical protein
MNVADVKRYVKRYRPTGAADVALLYRAESPAPPVSCMVVPLVAPDGAQLGGVYVSSRRVHPPPPPLCPPPPLLPAHRASRHPSRTPRPPPLLPPGGPTSPWCARASRAGLQLAPNQCQPPTANRRSRSMLDPVRRELMDMVKLMVPTLQQKLYSELNRKLVEVRQGPAVGWGVAPAVAVGPAVAVAVGGISCVVMPHAHCTSPIPHPQTSRGLPAPRLGRGA